MAEQQQRSIMTRKGFYTKVGGDFVGVYQSSEGPRLFINREIFDLSTPHWDVEMVKGRSRQILNFYWQGEVKFSVRCEANNEVFLPLFDYLDCRTALRHNA